MTKYNDIIYEIAIDNYGLISSIEAKHAGVSNMELLQYARRGKLDHVGHGLYRLSQRVPETNDPYALAVALVGPEAYLFGESVLAMFSLCPTNPAQMYIASPKRVRRKLPSWLQVIHCDEGAGVTRYEGIPSQNVRDAILSCKGKIMPDRLLAATEEAKYQGLLEINEAKTIKKELKD